MPARRPLTFLIFGDIVARPGRKALAEIVPQWRKRYQPDLVLANAENLAHGTGVTPKTLAECQSAGVDFFTSGNHVFKKKDVVPLLTDRDTVLLRPANYPPETPGVGHKIVRLGTKSVLVINLMGRVFFNDNYEDPFRTLDQILEHYRRERLSAILVDVHTEATSEAVALGWYADGRVSVVYGTHTHVPTADARVLPGGTGYISDIGMTGLRDSVLGVDKDLIIRKFLTQQPVAHEWPESGWATINAILVTVDPGSHQALEIKLLQKEIDV